MQWLKNWFLRLPHWTDLRAVSNSPAAKATVLIPIIGYLILFNEQVVKLLNIASELGGHSGATVSHRLILIYLGLIAVALGVILYGRYCPVQVKHYGGAAAYVGGDGPHLRGYVMNDIQEAVQGIPEGAKKLEELSGDLRERELRSDLSSEDYERYRIENLHVYFDCLNSSHPAARRVVIWSYRVGFGLLGIPSLEVFIRVLGRLKVLVLG